VGGSTGVRDRPAAWDAADAFKPKVNNRTVFNAGTG
jgi:hypothetical protein